MSTNSININQAAIMHIYEAQTFLSSRSCLLGTFWSKSCQCGSSGVWHRRSTHGGPRNSLTWRLIYQRCVVRGIPLSSLLSCRLPANLNSSGSPVEPTWAHLCWPGSRSVHGSIHSCVIGRPRFARRGHPKCCLGCLTRSRRLTSVNEW